MKGTFITLEGGEGAGKSTQARLLADRLTAHGYTPLLTRQPGGTPGAERLRTLLLQGDHALSLRAEILVHFAARLDHIEHMIAPALAEGRIVICDRFCDSTLAYQGYGLGHGDPGTLAFICSLIDLTALKPDLTLLLDLPRDHARSRLNNRGSQLDHYERLDEAFHHRVADGFLRIARDAPGRVVSVPADGDIDLVHQAILREVERRLPA